MKAIGIVRRLDQLGRIVIPREIFKNMGLQLATKNEKRSSIEIFTEDNMIIIKKYSTGCTLCGSDDYKEYKEYKGLKICKNCLKNFNE